MKEMCMFISWVLTPKGEKKDMVAHTLKGDPKENDTSFCGRKTVSIALFRGTPTIKKGETPYDLETYWFDSVEICPVCVERIKNKSGGQFKRE